ncbi:MAG: FAD-dependent oxidoreductase [Hyphomicrobiales bacterium]|nr:FAD-dependent oxidoreductase [Hyphomicrobiales bacterium]
MSNPPFPSHASVVVIGGGVMGCSTLYHLAKQGVGDAILLERNQLTSGTTWHSAAQVRALRSSRNLTDLIRYSVELYSELEAETGQATGWINKGSLSIATNKERLTHIRRQQSLANLYGVPAFSISKEEAMERWPLMNGDDVVGAVWSPEDGRVSPSDLCAALVKGAKSRGAQIFEDTGVTGIITKNGKIAGVETDKGRVDCDAIALCTGLWSRTAAALAGVKIPVWSCEHFYLLTKPLEGISGNMPTLSDHDGHLYIRDDSGGLLVGCFEPMGKAIDPDRIGSDFSFQLLPEDWDHFEPMMVNALHRLPSLETAEVKMLLNGPESFTPDGSFLLGESAETRGLFLGCGMNSVGVATGGGAGMALAHCILKGHTPVDLHEADPARFPDCFNSVTALCERVPEILGTHYEITFPGRQWTSSRSLRKMPCHSKWLAEKAHFGQFFGWERPLYFAKQSEPVLTFEKPDWFDQVALEVSNAHIGAAVFDQSTFGKIEVEGRDAERFLNWLCANNMDRSPGRAIYTSMLNERGGIESDLTAIRISEHHYRLFVGTGSIRRDWAWLQRHKGEFQITLRDSTEEFAVLALMGPDASAIIEKSGANELNALKYFEAGAAHIAGAHVRAVRLSYVGEAGWEITCKAQNATRIYDSLYQQGAKPAGLFAQSAMRIEKRFLSFGHDLDTDISPVQAGLDFAVAWDTNFIGKTPLENQREAGETNRIVTIILDDLDAVPIGNEPVLCGGEMVGKTTSAAFGYRIGKPLAIADIGRPELCAEGVKVSVDIAGRKHEGAVTLKPAFDPKGSRMRVS